MSKKHNCIISILIASLFWFASCDKNEGVNLVTPGYKTVEISCGGDFEIPLLTFNWQIESVLDVSSDKNMIDKNGNQLTLNGIGKVEAANGWLVLSHHNNGRLNINLKENFNKSQERKFIICIKEDKQRDYITVVQQSGSEYKLVKTEYKEIEAERKIYVSDEYCTDITLNNPTSEEVWEPTGGVFKDVVETSLFESDDYGAFEWLSEEDSRVPTPELIIDNAIAWNNRCYYTLGVTRTSYIKDIPGGSKVLMPPYSTYYLKGEITYCKRVCNYIFTIENVGTGTQFVINGIWTQIVPISSHIIGGDKPV